MSLANLAPQFNQEPDMTTTTTTLPQAHLGLFASLEERRAFLTVWRRFARTRKLSAADMLLRNLLLGLAPKRGFTPVTQPRKLNNGMQPYLSFDQARSSLVGTPTDYKYELSRKAYYDKAGKPAPQYVLDALEKPLAITEVWGCNLSTPEDFTAGLSLQRFQQAQALARSL